MEGVNNQIHHKSKTNKQRANKQTIQEIQNLQFRVFSHETNSHNKNVKSGRFSLHVGPEHKQQMIHKFGASLSFGTIFQGPTHIKDSPSSLTEPAPKFVCLQSSTSSAPEIEQ